MVLLKQHIKNSFGVEPETKELHNILFLRVHGIDNLSLSKWLEEEFDDIIVSVKYKRRNVYSDTDWILIEKKD